MRKILCFLALALITAMTASAQNWEAGAEIAAADLQAGDIILMKNANTANKDAMWFAGYHIVKGRTYSSGCDNYSLGMFPYIKDRSAFELVAGPTMKEQASFYFKEVSTGGYIKCTFEGSGYVELTDDITTATSFIPTAKTSGDYLVSYNGDDAWSLKPFHSYGEMHFGTGGNDMAGFKFYKAVAKDPSYAKGRQISYYDVQDGMELIFQVPYCYYGTRYGDNIAGVQYLDNTQISTAAHTWIATPFSDVPALATSYGYNEDNVWVLEYASPATTAGYSDFYYLKSKSTGEYIFRDADANAESSSTTADKTKATAFTFAPKSVGSYSYYSRGNYSNDLTVSVLTNDADKKYFGSGHGYGFAIYSNESFANWNIYKAVTDNKVQIDGLYYTFCGTTATVTYPGNTEPAAAGDNAYTGDIVIPATVDYGGTTYNVVDVDSKAFYYSTITSVTFPASVTAIGDYAFAYSSLTTINFSEGLVTIGDYAFQCCQGLTTVVLPNSVTTLGKQAFAGVSGKRMNISSFTFGPNVTTADKFLYYNSKSIVTDVYVPTYVVPYTGQYPVEGTANNKIHVYPSMVADFTANSYWARYNIVGDLPEVYVDGICYDLDEANHTATVINRGHLVPTSSIPSFYTGDVTIPATFEYGGETYTVTAIGENAFGYANVSSVTLSEGLQTIGKSAFAHSKITSIEIPNSVTTVGGDACAYIGSTLQTVIVGSGVTSFGQGFCYSTSPTNVYVKTTIVPSIGSYMFSGSPTIHVYSDMLSKFTATGWNNYGTLVGDLERDYTYAELQAKAAEAQGLAAYVGTNPGQYTAASYAGVQTALATYATVSATSPASTINACMNALVDAIDALESNPITEGWYYLVNAATRTDAKVMAAAVDPAVSTTDLRWAIYDKNDANQVFYLASSGSDWTMMNGSGLYVGEATGSYASKGQVSETAAVQKLYDFSYGKFFWTDSHDFTSYYPDGYITSPWSGFSAAPDLSATSGELHNFGAKTDTYNNNEYVNLWYLYPATVTSITIGATGYSTYVTDAALVIPDGVTAYGVTGLDGSNLTMTALSGNILAANEPVILQGEAGKTYYFINSEDAGSTIAGNQLLGTGDAGKAVAADEAYVLYNNNGTAVFRIAAAMTLPAHKTYLPAGFVSGSTSNMFQLGGDLTGLSNVQSSTLNAQSYFDLQGRKVAAPQKGQIYIVNGKTVLY
ncbi:MAG: leucine-rich repeat domain-containing protein [Bacteroidaceae bacterium]|nr:leucine-rich repeat domain-containing protein [Bacteroidaceae bacterium]